MDKDDIKCVTDREYWDRYEPSQLDTAMRYYVCEGHTRLSGKSLLEAELDCARQEERITTTPCETLVLLIGFSLEPLLQSVCVYQPQKIVLVLNQEGYPPEEWQVFADHVIEAIKHLVAKGLIPQQPQFFGLDDKGYPAVGEPAAVFRTLVKALHEETDVVIDVTGGKKSMVSGAFMYAAYAGTRISYVDFYEYAPKYRRPYGCSCKIGELSNPYREFALREWERVRALYGSYQFREARKLLTDSILFTMKNVLPASEAPIQKLGEFLTYYELWDSGNFGGAKRAVPALGAFDQPSSVTLMGGQWFETSGSDFTKKPKRFYGNMQVLQSYVYDELERIRRLIDYNEDYRSAFLRAGGVNEIVMLARVVRLVTNPTERDSLLDALDDRTPDGRKVFNALIDPGKTAIDVRRDIPFKGSPSITFSRPSPMTAWWKKTSLLNADDGWDTFLTRRNDLIHKYFSVPREWAEDALKFVQANLEDFLGHPISALGLKATTLSWSALCELCGVDPFLPPNLRKEA